MDLLLVNTDSRVMVNEEDGGRGELLLVNTDSSEEGVVVSGKVDLDWR